MSCHSDKSIINEADTPNSDDYKKVALVGNPNVGKSQIFNLITNLHQMVGNFPGITVSTSQGLFKSKSVKAFIIDLPGSYSLSNSNNVEVITRDWIVDNKPDLLVNVIDSSNIERNLILTLILIEFDIPLVLVLNMDDIARNKGFKINSEVLQKILNIPVYSLVAVKKDAKTNLKKWLEQKIIDLPSKPRLPEYNKEIVKTINKLNDLLSPEVPMPVWYSTKLLEGNEKYNEIIQTLLSNSKVSHNCEDNNQNKCILQNIDSIVEGFKKNHEDYQTVLLQEKHKFIRKILPTIQIKFRKDQSLTQHLDIVLTNKYLGIPIFILIVWIMFQLTFEISKPFTDYITILLALLSSIVETVLGKFPHTELLISFINDGIISGAGTVLSFLPIVFFLFIAIAILEDSGYFSRGSFIVDKLMVQFGLEGRSFVPMVLGFGCNIPGVLSTRNIEGKRERLLTISILPFMSCSARLPIYILFGTMFFYRDATELILFLYLLGVVIGLLVVLIFKAILKKKNFFSTPLILEMPPYMMPNINSVLNKSVTQARSFLKKITSIVLLGSAIIWLLSHIVLNPLQLQLTPAYDQTLLGILGKFIQPIFAPLGFNWKLVIALIFGLMAKEVIISTISILYLGTGVLSGHLTHVLLQDPSLTPLVALTYMVFVLLYIPCIATIGIIKSETSKKYATFVMLYTFVVAYTISWIFFTLGSIIL